MHNFFSNALHLFVVLIIVAFIVGGTMAIAGSFDHWGSRYKLKRRRNRLLRKRAAKTGAKDQHQINAMPYYSSNPGRTTIADKAWFA